MIESEDIMKWVLVFVLAYAVFQTIDLIFKLLPDTKYVTKYLCTDNEVYSKRYPETFWRKENVKCITEDKE